MTRARLVLVAVALGAAACDPGTTRPDLLPFPEARSFEVARDRGAAIGLLADRLRADTIPVGRVDTLDAWLETPWFDAGTRRLVRGDHVGMQFVKLRAWADPARPTHAELIVELAYRPVADPSLPGRMLERPLPETHYFARHLDSLLNRLQAEVGFEPPAGAR